MAASLVEFFTKCQQFKKWGTYFHAATHLLFPVGRALTLNLLQILPCMHGSVLQKYISIQSKRKCPAVLNPFTATEHHGNSSFCCEHLCSSAMCLLSGTMLGWLLPCVLDPKTRTLFQIMRTHRQPATCSPFLCQQPVLMQTRSRPVCLTMQFPHIRHHHECSHLIQIKQT